MINEKDRGMDQQRDMNGGVTEILRSRKEQGGIQNNADD